MAKVRFFLGWPAVMLLLSWILVGGPARAGAARSPLPVSPSLGELAPSDPCGAWPNAGTRKAFQVSVGGATYTVPVRIPNGTGKRSAVILLHGGGGTGLNMVAKSGYDDIVAGTNTILVSPDAAVVTPLAVKGDGQERRWNTGKYEDGVDARFPRDDVAFLDAITKALRVSACVDRVLVTGFSAGAAMANRWMCQGSSPPDAMVTAAGSMSVPAATCKNPARPIRMYVGDRDPRLAGPSKPGTNELGVKATAEIWAKRNACPGETKTVTLTSDTTCTVWKGCGAPVEMCVIRGFPHAWPRGPSGDPPTSTDAGKSGYTWLDEVTRR